MILSMLNCQTGYSPCGQNAIVIYRMHETFSILKKFETLYNRGLWKRITLFLHFSCKPSIRLKSHSQVSMYSPELVKSSRYVGCTITRRCWLIHTASGNILQSQLKLFDYFLCLNFGAYDTITSNAVYRRFLLKVIDNFCISKINVKFEHHCTAPFQKISIS